MKEYFISLVFISVACGIIEVLSPRDDIGKYIRFLCGVCMFCIIISPVRSFLQSIDSVAEIIDNSLGEITNTEEYYENIFKDSLMSGTAEDAAMLIKSKISSDMKINKDSFDVELYLGEDSNGYYIKSVVLKIYQSGIFIDASTVVEYLERNLDASCVVVYV